MKKLNEFQLAYIECALWSSTDNSNEQGGEPLDKNYSIEDITPETLEVMLTECNNFQYENEELLEGLDDSQCGHDFWLTRNHHGAGFWDRGYNKVLGEALTKASHDFGEVDLYISDDGKIYQS